MLTQNCQVLFLEIKVTHSIAPANLHSSISVTGMFERLPDCAIEVKSIFRNIDALANSAISVSVSVNPLTPTVAVWVQL